MRLFVSELDTGICHLNASVRTKIAIRSLPGQELGFGTLTPMVCTVALGPDRKIHTWSMNVMKIL